MATLIDSRQKHVGPIDSNQAPVFETFSFTVPTLNDTDWDQAIVSYDRLSDILLVFVADRGQPAVVVYGDEHDDMGACLVNPDTMEFVGWQVESFLLTKIRTHPHLIKLLDHVELIGLTADELRQERRRVLGLRGRIRDWLNQAFGNPLQRRPSRKADILGAILAGGRSPRGHGPLFRIPT